MALTKTEKIVVGSTVIIGACALTMMAMSNKYNAATSEIQSELSDIRYTLSKSREDLIILNRETVEGNRILRKLIKESAEDIVDDLK